MKKQKHNFWIDGLDAGENFFMWIQSFGWAFMFLMLVITCLYYWTTLALNSPEFLFFAVFMINVIRLGIWMFLLGFILKHGCNFLSKLLYQKELKKLEREGDKIVNTKTRKSNKSTTTKKKRFP